MPAGILLAVVHVTTAPTRIFAPTAASILVIKANELLAVPVDVCYNAIVPLLGTFFSGIALVPVPALVSQ